MIEKNKPVVIVSKCLGFDKCRYNGQTIPDKFIEHLQPFVTFIPVCPEVEIGLGIPREPIRVVLHNSEPRLYQPATELDITDRMVTFVTTYLNDIEQVDGFILKNRSPSCGISDVRTYTGFDKPMPAKKGSGFFGGAVIESFPNTPIEDEGRLTNFTIREHFLTELYTFYRFKAVKAAGNIKSLMDFQRTHKLLFLGYNEAEYRAAGRIVANHEKKPMNIVFSEYEQTLSRIFKNQPKRGSIINTLLHAFGGFSENITPQERKYFLNSIEEYRDERIPLSTLNHMIHAYALRFDNTFLMEQIFFNPYPRELAAISDSGKGRKF